MPSAVRNGQTLDTLLMTTLLPLFEDSCRHLTQLGRIRFRSNTSCYRNVECLVTARQEFRLVHIPAFLKSVLCHGIQISIIEFRHTPLLEEFELLLSILQVLTQLLKSFPCVFDLHLRGRICGQMLVHVTGNFVRILRLVETHRRIRLHAR